MLTEARAGMLAALADVLTIPVHPAWPEKPSPPMCTVVPNNGPYVEVAPFEEYLVNLDVLVLVARTSTALADLEAITEDVLRMCAPGTDLGSVGTYGVAGVDGPAALTIGTTQCLGTLIHLNTLEKLT